MVSISDESEESPDVVPSVKFPKLEISLSAKHFIKRSNIENIIDHE